MYIRLEGNRHLLIRQVKGSGEEPKEVILADLGEDPEINLFSAAEQGRRNAPELWEGITDFHLLQAFETYKRRIGNFRPALVMVKGKAKPDDKEEKS